MNNYDIMKLIFIRAHENLPIWRVIQSQTHHTKYF